MSPDDGPFRLVRDQLVTNQKTRRQEARSVATLRDLTQPDLSHRSGPDRIRFVLIRTARRTVELIATRWPLRLRQSQSWLRVTGLNFDAIVAEHEFGDIFRRTMMLPDAVQVADPFRSSWPTRGWMRFAAACRTKPSVIAATRMTRCIGVAAC